MLSVIDFGADPTGDNDSTQAFTDAAAATGGGTIYVPKGTYRIDRCGILKYAGLRIIGESQYTTVLKAKDSAVGPMLWNENSVSNPVGTAQGVYIEGVFFDTAGQDVTCVDLAAVNRSLLIHCLFQGGANANNRTGLGVRFLCPDPTRGGSYDNRIVACSFQNLDRGVHWDTGGNANELHGCDAIACDVGWDAQPTTVVEQNVTPAVDTPRIFGGRVENCRIGLNDGAQYGMYFGLRFEASSQYDINFVAGSDHPQIVGGYTASSANVLNGISNSDTPVIQSSDLGWIERENTSRARQSAARHVFAASGQALSPNPLVDYAAYFQDYVLLKNSVPLEGVYGANHTNRVVIAYVDNSGNVCIPGYDRANQVYNPVLLGSVLSARQDGLYHSGTKVVGSQGAALPNVPSGGDPIPTLNTLLARLRTHGLIAS